MAIGVHQKVLDQGNFEGRSQCLGEVFGANIESHADTALGSSDEDLCKDPLGGTVSIVDLHFKLEEVTRDVDLVLIPLGSSDGEGACSRRLGT